MEFLETYAAPVDKELKALLGREPKELYEPIEYHLFSGGKRVRPVICLLACEAVSGSFKEAIPIASAIELVHAFSLVHDDIMDHDDLRRGRETLYKRCGEAAAINIGDGIYTLAYKSALCLKVQPNIAIQVVRTLNDSILEVCEGQALDISFEERDTVSIEEYNHMSRLKTGALIRASAETGAQVGGGSNKEIKALRRYGENIGLAFQIWDDYIDFASTKTGKTQGSDIKNGKKTSIVSHALENAESADKEKLLTILNTESSKTSTEQIKDAISILDKTGSIEHGKSFATQLVEDAKKELAVLKESKAKEHLIAIADFIVKRSV